MFQLIYKSVNLGNETEQRISRFNKKNAQFFWYSKESKKEHLPLPVVVDFFKIMPRRVRLNSYLELWYKKAGKSFLYHNKFI